MEWDIEYTDELGEWWDGLTEGEQESVRASVKLIGDLGGCPRMRYLSFRTERSEERNL
jgi:hypothetical protein